MLQRLRDMARYDATQGARRMTLRAIGRSVKGRSLWMATLRDSEDLVSVGAYVRGSSPRIDTALEKRDAIGGFLCQSADTHGGLPDALTALHAL